MTQVERRSRGSRFVAYALIGIMLTAMGYGMGVWSAPVTSFGIDGSGNFHGNEVHVNDVVSEGDVHTSSLYVNGERVTATLPYSYIVNVTGSTFYSKNTQTGAISSNSNATILLQSVLTAIASNQGSAFVKAGTYPLGNSGLVQSTGTTIMGEGMDSTVFTYTGSGAAYTIGNAAGYTDYCVLENFKIMATGAATSSATAIGLKTINMRHSTVSQFHIRDFNSGICLVVSATDTFYDATNVFSRFRIKGNNIGIKTTHDSGANTNRPNDDIFKEGAILGPGANGTAIYLDYGSTLRIQDIDLEGWNYGVWITTNIDYVYIAPRLESITIKGVVMATGCSRITIDNKYQAAITITNNGTYPRLLGFGFSNQGIANIASGTTSIVVNHGVEYTPDRTNIYLNIDNPSTNAPGLIWANSIGATQMTLNCQNDPGVGGLYIDWRIIGSNSP